MKMESLTIALRNTWGAPGPNNPYEAKLSVDFNDTRMQVKLSDETATKILRMVSAEISAAAQVQIDRFVNDAISAGETPQLENDYEPDP